MAKHFNPTPTKTYKNVTNLERAIAHIPDFYEKEPVRYVISINGEGRYFPVFIGINAMRMGVHFQGFCVITG